MRNYSSIKELVIATCTREGRFPSYEKLTALVLDNFPRSGWQKSHYLWYKSKIKSREIIVPKLNAFDDITTESIEVLKVDNPAETSSNLERDLHAYLVKTVTDIEENLVLEPNGIDYVTEAGTIDLLAKDVNDQLVVIQLLVNIAKDSALGQLLGFMGCIAEQNENHLVRGILIASNFEKRVIYAAKALPQVKLVKYRVAFKLEEVI